MTLLWNTPCQMGSFKFSEFLLQDNKKKELHSKIEQVKSNIADFTQSIETMRITRDSTVAKNGQLNSELEVRQKIVSSD